MIRYEQFSKRYGGIRAVEELSLVVHPGETVALVGPNGSGKTTTLKALTGLVRPTAGRVSVSGIDATTGGAEARRLVGYLPQRATFPDGLSARRVMHLFARLRGVPTLNADGLLERVGLGDAADRGPDEYSGGMRQRLGLAIALLGSPPVLVLDEPSAALDPTGALMVRDIIRDIRRDGTTVLISSHDLAEVAALADRLAIFADGRLQAAGALATLEREAGVTGVDAVYRFHALVAPRPARAAA